MANDPACLWGVFRRVVAFPNAVYFPLRIILMRALYGSILMLTPVKHDAHQVFEYAAFGVSKMIPKLDIKNILNQGAEKKNRKSSKKLLRTLSPLA